MSSYKKRRDKPDAESFIKRRMLGAENSHGTHDTMLIAAAFRPWQDSQHDAARDPIIITCGPDHYNTSPWFYQAFFVAFFQFWRLNTLRLKPVKTCMDTVWKTYIFIPPTDLNQILRSTISILISGWFQWWFQPEKLYTLFPTPSTTETRPSCKKKPPPIWAVCF